MWIIKALIIIVFGVIFWQDYKQRLVYWFLYPLVGIIAFYIQAQHILLISALLNSLINLTIVSIIILISFLYSKLIMKSRFINHSIGLGDLLLFIFLSFSFSTIPFTILLVFSLVFSLVVHLYFKRKSTHQNVPLAGYISLFFLGIYLTSIFLEPKYLFAY